MPEGTKIKNDPRNYRTRASLASAPVRDAKDAKPSREVSRAFLTAPIDERFYIDLRKVTPEES